MSWLDTFFSVGADQSVGSWSFWTPTLQTTGGDFVPGSGSVLAARSRLVGTDIQCDILIKFGTGESVGTGALILPLTSDASRKVNVTSILGSPSKIEMQITYSGGDNGKSFFGTTDTDPKKVRTSDMTDISDGPGVGDYWMIAFTVPTVAA